MVTPHSKCKVVVNGVPIMGKMKLQHLVTFPAWSQNSLSPTHELGQGGGPRQVPLALRCGQARHQPPSVLLLWCHEGHGHSLELEDLILARCVFLGKSLQFSGLHL